jgi:hypothetical protein
VFVLLVMCYTMYSLCNQQYIQYCSGVLVVYVCCITVSKLSNPEVCVDIAQGLKGIWVFAEVFLFTLTGTSLSFDSSNGPLYGQRGLNNETIKKVIGMIFIGTCGRILGLGVCMALIYPTLPPHRKEAKWLLPFWLNCWIYQIPKATVQATLGSVAYTQHIIPGAVGLNKGLFIAQATAFTVLIFAPIGTFLVKYVGSPISVYLERLDKENGWSSSDNKYGILPTSSGVNASSSYEEVEVHRDDDYMAGLNASSNKLPIDPTQAQAQAQAHRGHEDGAKTPQNPATIAAVERARAASLEAAALADQDHEPSEADGTVRRASRAGRANSRGESLNDDSDDDDDIDSSAHPTALKSRKPSYKNLSLKDPETVDATLNRVRDAGAEVIAFLQRYQSGRVTRSNSNASHGRDGDDGPSDGNADQPQSQSQPQGRGRSTTLDVIEFLSRRMNGEEGDGGGSGTSGTSGGGKGKAVRRISDLGAGDSGIHRDGANYASVDAHGDGDGAGDHSRGPPISGSASVGGHTRPRATTSDVIDFLANRIGMAEASRRPEDTAPSAARATAGSSGQLDREGDLVAGQAQQRDSVYSDVGSSPIPLDPILEAAEGEEAEGGAVNKGEGEGAWRLGTGSSGGGKGQNDDGDERRPSNGSGSSLKATDFIPVANSDAVASGSGSGSGSSGAVGTVVGESKEEEQMPSSMRSL